MPNNDKQNQRNVKRKLTIISAVIKDEEETFSYVCTIRDASQDGCRIYCSEASNIPDNFLLCPGGLEKPLAAKVAWRKGKWLGLSIAWEQVLFDT